jgi:DNA-binding GntR family transcriptional regulator
VTLDLPISQSELALLIGASRPKVNAALALLEDGGAIQRGEKTFICDIEALEDIAGAA